MIINAHIERLLCVDVKVVTWTVAISSACVLDVNGALAFEITRFGGVPAKISWRFAGVECRVEAPLISLHEVELWATFSTVLGLLCTTVPVGSVPQ